MTNDTIPLFAFQRSRSRSRKPGARIISAIVPAFKLACGRLQIYLGGCGRDVLATRVFEGSFSRSGFTCFGLVFYPGEKPP